MTTLTDDRIEVVTDRSTLGQLSRIEARRYARHATATLFPGRGEGLAESAAEYNRGGRRL